MKRTIILIFIVIMTTAVMAQSSFVATGGTAAGTGGTATFTVGQIAVQSNSDGTSTISEGVQQPFEISTVGIDNYPDISLNAMVYPNPTAGNLQLTIYNEQLIGEAQVYDENGKLLIIKNIQSSITQFDLTPYAPGTYFLRVSDGKQVLKNFKVVKLAR